MNCNECKYNKNGWCKKYNLQRPKALEVCNYKENEEETIINTDTNIEIPNKEEFIDLVKDMFDQVDNNQIDSLEYNIINIVKNISQIERLNILLGRE